MVKKFYNQVINIETWRADERYDGIYSEGAREKDIVFSPADSGIEGIKSNWRYMFKLSRSLDWCPWQFWVEIIAYRLGCLIGIQVPPAFVGYTAKYKSSGPDTRVYGALIEWFYDETKDIFVHGGQFMVQLIEGYDRDKGEMHNFDSIAGVFENIPGFVEHWAGVFLLDTLIGNTDRHHDNWGIVFYKGRTKPKAINISFSPAFDNGTAMEYGEQEINFDKYKDPKKLQKHLEDARFARHHMKWSLKEKSPLNFYQFVDKFVSKYPDSKSIIAKHLNFSHEQLEDIMIPLCDMITDSKFELNKSRLNFMLDMMFHRKLLLEKQLKI